METIKKDLQRSRSERLILFSRRGGCVDTVELLFVLLPSESETRSSPTRRSHKSTHTHTHSNSVYWKNKSIKFQTKQNHENQLWFNKSYGTQHGKHIILKTISINNNIIERILQSMPIDFRLDPFQETGLIGRL